MTDVTIEELEPKLEKLGFGCTRWPADGIMRRKLIFHRRIPERQYDGKVCQTNDKLSLHIEYAEFSLRGVHIQKTVEVEIVGDTGNDWVEVKIYSIPLEILISELPNLERRLLAAWQAIQP